jgi:hypothetical protein
MFHHRKAREYVVVGFGEVDRHDGLRAVEREILDPPWCLRSVPLSRTLLPVDEARAAGDVALEDVTIAGRGLLARGKVRVPHAARTRRREVARGNVAAPACAAMGLFVDDRDAAGQEQENESRRGPKGRRTAARVPGVSTVEGAAFTRNPLWRSHTSIGATAARSSVLPKHRRSDSSRLGLPRTAAATDGPLRCGRA